ncbi:MAG: hypothetical protein HY831_00925 [Candidatus Aenigmarchaeota archaeon]|nr:hypothetical protein [Candidatus Aenigmarchaeota archaeon]
MIANNVANGHYDPAGPIAIGSTLWTFGNFLEGYRIYSTEDLNTTGTKIRLLGIAIQVTGAALLASGAAGISSVPNYESLLLVPAIATGGGLNAAGIGVDNLGKYLNDKDAKKSGIITDEDDYFLSIM